MKQVYLVRASGERMGPFDVEFSAGYGYSERILVTSRDRKYPTSFTLDAIKSLGFTIEPVEEKPKVARYWWLVKSLTGSKDEGVIYNSILATEVDIKEWDDGYIKDPSRPDPVYLE